MSTPKNYIIAESWNGSAFFFNVHEQTWDRADDTVLTEAHDAEETDMISARIVARTEGFAANSMQMLPYTEA